MKIKEYLEQKRSKEILTEKEEKLYQELCKHKKNETDKSNTTLPQS